jgi:flagellar biosynthesis/type III secretory pathway M-ring protein FliF/YscJ
MRYVNITVLLFMIEFLVAMTPSYAQDMVVLYDNLSVDAVGRLEQALDQMKIPYQVTPDNKAINVPADQKGRAVLSVTHDGFLRDDAAGTTSFYVRPH